MPAWPSQKKGFPVPTLTCVGSKLLLGYTPNGEAIYSSAGIQGSCGQHQPGSCAYCGGAQGSSLGRAHQP